MPESILLSIRMKLSHLSNFATATEEMDQLEGELCGPRMDLHCQMQGVFRLFPELKGLPAASCPFDLIIHQISCKDLKQI